MTTESYEWRPTLNLQFRRTYDGKTMRTQNILQQQWEREDVYGRETEWRDVPIAENFLR